MKEFLLVLTCLLAVLDWLAVWKAWRRVGYFAKPFTMLVLFTWFILQTGLKGPSIWFGLGLIFSMAGDIFLMLSRRYFLAGMGAFSLVHVVYLVGFLSPFPRAGVLPASLMGILLVILAVPLMQRIRDAQLVRGSKKLIVPTMSYAVLINLMTLSALWCLFRPDWSFTNGLLVSLGALFFYGSDLLNAWIRFVNPARKGRTLVMISYHIGQVLLMLGVVSQLKILPVV